MVDAKRARGRNHVKLSIDIDGLSRAIVFKSGGSIEAPESYMAVSGGGYTCSDLYASWEVSGVATVSKSLAQFLFDAYEKQRGTITTSAVLEVYSTTDSYLIKHMFKNCRIAKMPQIQLEELGGEVELAIAFSLNDLENSGAYEV
ncbi:MAG: hypothetical protein ACRCVN_05965 [Spirochaetia bacterium]